MTGNSIAIRNIYVMMAYAFKAIQKAGDEHLEVEQFDKLHDLFAEILVRGVGAQVKRGLHHDYLHRREELATVRGRIDVSRSIAEHSKARGRLICGYDEYDSDTPHNRALRACQVFCVRAGRLAPLPGGQSGSLLGNCTAKALSAWCHPCVPVPRSPPRVVSMFRMPR